MRFGLTFVLLLAGLLSACDSEITGSVSSETIPREVQEECATDQDLAHSDCPAIELSNICDPFLCKANPEQNQVNEIALATDYTLPECGQECKAMDCTTIECLESNIYGELAIEINQDGDISVSGIMNDEVAFTCQTRTSCGQ